MSALDAALLVLLVHGAFGAFDTFYAHEWEARLPKQPWAGRELSLHAARSLLYAPLFVGLAWFEWRGAFAWLLFAVFAAEYLLTLVDFRSGRPHTPLVARGTPRTHDSRSDDWRLRWAGRLSRVKGVDRCAYGLATDTPRCRVDHSQHLRCCCIDVGRAGCIGF